MRPVFVAGLENFLDESAAKSGAIDEELPGNLKTAGQVEALNVPGGCISGNADNFALYSLDSLSFTVATQVLCIEGGIEVKCVRNVEQRRVLRIHARPGELTRVGCCLCDRIGRQISCQPGAGRLFPSLLEARQLDILARPTEAVHVAIPFATPIGKFNTE